MLENLGRDSEHVEISGKVEGSEGNLGHIMCGFLIMS